MFLFVPSNGTRVALRCGAAVPGISTGTLTYTSSSASGTRTSTCARFQSSSTMSLQSPVSSVVSTAPVSVPPQLQKPSASLSSFNLMSTLHFSEKKDFSTAVSHQDDEEYWNAVMAAAVSVPLQSQFELPSIARACELDLVEAAATKDTYDKVLLLVRHGSADFKKASRKAKDTPLQDPLMNRRGVGQVLNLSRRTATFCNDEKGLQPELIVTSPLKRAIQTATMIFPYDTPQASLTKIPWVCHSTLVEATGRAKDTPMSSTALNKMFPGMSHYMGDGGDGNDDLLQRSNEFMEWIKQREEKIIVVSSHSTWLQSLCGHTLHYDDPKQESELFKSGEMRAVGINFD